MTVLVPALDEEHDIRGCLEAVAAQTYPGDLVEVVVVDGCSTDATVAVARAAADDLGLALRVETNALRRTSTSLNAGLAVATGDVVVRVDARSRIQPNYVESCVGLLETRHDVGVVGGRQVPVARSSSTVDLGIARALANRYATGLARYRRSSTSGPADTVWMGCFRTDELRAIGGWPAEFGANEDWELNRRYRDAGRLVWFEADLHSGYLPRHSITRLAHQYHSFGLAKGGWWSRGMRPEPRHVALVLGPPFVATGWLALARRRPLLALVAVPLGLLALDQAGGDPTERAVQPGVRAVSAAAILTYTTAWWSGVVRGLAGGRREGLRP